MRGRSTDVTSTLAYLLHHGDFRSATSVRYLTIRRASKFTIRRMAALILFRFTSARRVQEKMLGYSGIAEARYLLAPISSPIEDTCVVVKCARANSRRRPRAMAMLPSLRQTPEPAGFADMSSWRRRHAFVVWLVDARGDIRIGIFIWPYRQ